MGANQRIDDTVDQMHKMQFEEEAELQALDEKLKKEHAEKMQALEEKLAKEHAAAFEEREEQWKTAWLELQLEQRDKREKEVNYWKNKYEVMERYADQLKEQIEAEWVEVKKAGQLEGQQQSSEEGGAAREEEGQGPREEGGAVSVDGQTPQEEQPMQEQQQQEARGGAAAAVEEERAS